MPYPLDEGLWPAEDLYPDGTSSTPFYAATFTASLVSRVPELSGVPTLTEVDRLVFDSLSYTDELNRPGSATLTCPTEAMSDVVKARLVDLGNYPCEVWVYRDSRLVWAGGVETIGGGEGDVTIGCVGLAGYLFRMGLTTDLSYAEIDQFEIAAGLVDHWQSLLYGNYGILTSDIGESGVLRDRTYRREELNSAGELLQNLSAVIDGFDFHVDPDSRDLVLSYPQRGEDLSSTVFFDERNIDSAGVSISVAPDDLVSDLSATGTSQDTAGTNVTVYAERTNGGLRTTFGRSWAGQNFSSVSAADTIQGHADAYLAPRGRPLFQPGVTLIPRVGADVGDFGPGDSIEYSYDAGLGRQTGVYRIAKRTVKIEASGSQRIGVEFV